MRIFLFAAATILVIATAATTNAAITGTLSQCSSSCTTDCTSYNFTSGSCFSLKDSTPVSVTCGGPATCIVGTLFTDEQCSAPAPRNFTAVADGTCGTIGQQYTYFMAQPDNTGVKMALACGIACADCVAVSPTRAWGSCVAFPGGSLMLTKSVTCQSASMNVFATSCSDDVPDSVLNLGSNDPGVCRAATAPTGNTMSYSLTCNGMGTTTAPTPVPGAPTLAPPTPPPGPTTPAPPVAPMIVTRELCTDLMCKSCRPRQFPQGFCQVDYSVTPPQSFLALCPTSSSFYITMKHWNNTQCSGSPSLVDYDVPGNCMVTPQNTSYSMSCRKPSF